MHYPITRGRDGCGCRRLPVPLAVALSVFALRFAALGAPAASAADKLEYNRDIRPILSENCFACHGPDSAARKAELRLDRPETAVERKAIIPGKPDESELVVRVLGIVPGKKSMPPPSTQKKLSDHQKDLLRRWIAEGAEYQPHWSFIAPRRPQPPAVKRKEWVQNPIDSFVLAKLEEKGLESAPEADRRTIARRLSLDLTGLPPAPAEVDAFVSDSSPEAYESLADRWLESKSWGEHRARYWLDAARYADTHGIHFDNYREMWAYRDWVINAFNRNLPFDRFTIEQLAGDLLEDRTLETQVASGFNRCNLTTNEGGVIPEEYLVHYTRDRTETTSQVWLGLTAGCAVCHDHKFDPLTQREFYEMAAYFNNTTQGAMDGNIKDTPPTVVVPGDEDRARWDALPAEIAGAKQRLEGRREAARADFDRWLEHPPVDSLASMVPTDGLQLHAPLNEGDGSSVHVSVSGQPRELRLASGIGWDSGHLSSKAYRCVPGDALEVAEAGDFDRGQPFSCGVWARIPKTDVTGSVVARMEDQNGFRGWDIWVEKGRIGSHIVHRWQEDALKVVSKDPVKPDAWNHLLLTCDGSGKAAGVKLYVNGVPQETKAAVDSLQSTFRTSVPLKVAQRHTTSRLNDILLEDLRIYTRALSTKEAAQLVKATRAASLASKPADKRTREEANELYDGWLAEVDRPYQDLESKISRLEEEQSAIKSRATLAHVMAERGEAPAAFILFRGEYDKRRDPVKADTPDILPPLPQEFPRSRLGFARWLLLPEHPLTARVTVNRFWQEVFGTGLVRTAGDFGTSGELPSHPELLDWLAVELRESGWDVKRFFKLLVTSATYRQAAVATPENLEKDPQNRLLSRGPRFRMDAEMVRDCALASSGLLVSAVGGRSVKPYQPDGVWEAVAMMESNTRYYKRDSGDNLYRRSLYTFWKRAAPPASMDIFNAPSREVCTIRRERTNTPLQALVTLNDDQFVEAARNLAQIAIKEGGEATENRLDLMAKRLLARPLRPEEKDVVEASLRDLIAHYRDHADDAKALVSVGESKADPSLDASTLAAWTMLSNQLMNLDEVLNK